MIRVLWQQLTRVEETLDKLVNKLSNITPTISLSTSKPRIKQTDQVVIKPNPKITGFKLNKDEDWPIEDLIESLSKKLSEVSLQAIKGEFSPI